MTYKYIDINEINKWYNITKDGEILNKETNINLRQTYDKKGYKHVYLSQMKQSYSVHRLVLVKYIKIDNPESYQVNHKDGIHDNDCLTNLEWNTQSQNQKHAFKNNFLDRKGVHNSQNKLNEKSVNLIINDLLNQIPLKIIAENYNVSKSLICRIKTKRAWIELTKNIEFPKSKYEANNLRKSNLSDSEINNIIEELKNGIDIDIISEKYNTDKRYVRDLKYRILNTY